MLNLSVLISFLLSIDGFEILLSDRGFEMFDKCGQILIQIIPILGDTLLLLYRYNLQ